MVNWPLVSRLNYESKFTFDYVCSLSLWSWVEINHIIVSLYYPSDSLWVKLLGPVWPLGLCGCLRARGAPHGAYGPILSTLGSVNVFIPGELFSGFVFVMSLCGIYFT